MDLQAADGPSILPEVVRESMKACLKQDNNTYSSGKAYGLRGEEDIQMLVPTGRNMAPPRDKENIRSDIPSDMSSSDSIV